MSRNAFSCLSCSTTQYDKAEWKLQDDSEVIENALIHGSTDHEIEVFQLLNINEYSRSMVMDFSTSKMFLIWSDDLALYRD